MIDLSSRNSHALTASNHMLHDIKDGYANYDHYIDALSHLRN